MLHSKAHSLIRPIIMRASTLIHLIWLHLVSIMKPISDNLVEDLAYYLGALGSILLASNTSLSPLGYLVWIPSNFFAAILMERKGLNKMLRLTLLNTIIVFFGIYRWML